MRRTLTILCLSLACATGACFAAAPPDAPVADASAKLDARDPAAGPAVAALRRAHPDDPSVGVLQVRWLLQQGEREDALDLAEGLADDFPDHAQAQYWLGNAYGQRIGEVGMLRQASYAPKLRAAFERALALDPSIHEARVSLVQFHLQAPGIVGGDPAVAKVHQRELARRDPPRGHWTRGMIADAEGESRTAAEAYVAAWTARPDVEAYRLSAGVGLQTLERWDDAHALFKTWTAENPAKGAAWYQLGRLAALSGRHAADGIAALRHYLTLTPGRGDPGPQHAWWRLGQIQAAADDVAAARASFQQALKLDPDLEEAEAELAKL